MCVIVIVVVCQNIGDHEQCVKLVKIDNVHSSPVNEILYLHENDYILSCSSDANKSVVCMDTEGKKKMYTFQLPKVKLLLLTVSYNVY